MPPKASRSPASSSPSGADGSISLTLAKGLAVLSAFRAGETYLSNRELADRTGYTKPTVSRLARTLLELGYLRHSETFGLYALGPAVLTLSYPMLAGLGIRHIARPFMHELAEEVSGQVSMGMRDRHAMVFVESARSRAHRLTLPEIGATIPLLASSMGRAYLAALAPDPRDVLLAELERADPGAFAAYSASVREAVETFPERGFACSFGDVRREMFACAAPLRVRVDGEIVVVNCGVPAAAMSRDEFVRIIGPKLVAATRSIDAAAGAGITPDRREPASPGWSGMEREMDGMTRQAERPDQMSRLFAPRSVAIVGASDDPARISGRALRFLREAGFAGGLYPVNPRRETVQGLPACASVADLPETPDVALVAVPAARVLDAVRDCAARGVAGVYIFSSGFSEAGAEGAEAQAEILRVARAADMRVLGPNCLGAFNSAIGFFGMFATSLDRGLPSPGPVAVVSQSGAHGQHLAYMAGQRGLGVTYCITTGNEMDVDMAEALDWTVRQPEVEVVMAYCEGVRDGARLVSALETARALKKPVVFMKVGSSVAGARAVSSHTSALAGEDAVIDAVLRQHGVWRAASTSEQVDIAYACARDVRPASDRIGLISVSGGGGVQMADFAERAGLDAAPMPAAVREKLQEIMPFAAPENPVDVTGQVVNDASLLERALRVLCNETDYDTIAGYFTTVALDRGVNGPLREALLRGTEGHRKLFVLCMLADPETVRAYEEAGFLVYEEPARAMTAVAALRFFARSFERTEKAAAGTLPRALPAPADPLDEAAAKRLLAEAGLPVLPETLARTADEAARAAEAIGRPVALKLVSPDIHHKTEIGGVLLDLPDAEAVREGHATLLARARAAAPSARLSGVLVAPMAPRGIETIIGVSNDPAFGPVVMFGLGGVFVEVFRDVSFRAAPFDEAEARRMIAETKAAALLAGARGAPAADLDALARALAAVSRFAAANAGWLDSLDINPFLVFPAGEGAAALDAAILAADHAERHDS